MSTPGDKAKTDKAQLIADLKRQAMQPVGKGPRLRRAVGAPAFWISKVRLSPPTLSPFLTYQRNRGEVRAPTAADFDFQDRVLRGEALHDDEFPSRLYLEASQRFTGRIPEVMGSGKFAIVHKDVAALLTGHDLGDTILRPVELIDGDWETVLSCDHLLVNLRNPRPTLDIAASRSLRQEPVRPGAVPHVDILYSRLGEPVDFVALAGAEKGPELWIDPRITAAVFPSDALARRLLDAGLGHAFLPAPCHLAANLIE